MPWHEWGSDFDFGGLDKAQHWIVKFYRRATGLQMHTKEKYGTIRYEFEFLWIKENHHATIWFEVARRATVKFPEFAGEIVSDIAPIIADKDHITGYYKGYFDAILWLKHKSKWESFK